MKAANRRIMERLKRVSDGLPVGRPAKTRSTPWCAMAPHKRDGNENFHAICDGCGRTNWFMLRKKNRRLEWRPYRPHGVRYSDSTPTMNEALKNQTGLSKSLIQRIIDEHTEESDVKKQ